MRKFVIDVGSSDDASRGIQMRDQLNCPAIFIEPNLEALEKVKTKENDLKINCAISNYDGEIEFYYYQENTHSVLKTNLNEIHNYIDGYSGVSATVENWSPKRIEKIKCIKLRSLIDEYQIDSIPYLKIDTQGHDLEVIRGLEDKISIVELIECEVQLTNFEIYLGQTKREDLMKYLEEKDFLLIGSQKQTFNQEENLIFKNKKFL